MGSSSLRDPRCQHPPQRVINVGVTCKTASSSALVAWESVATQLVDKLLAELVGIRFGNYRSKAQSHRHPVVVLDNVQRPDEFKVGHG